MARGRQIVERGAALHVRRDQLARRRMPAASGREGCGIQDKNCVLAAPFHPQPVQTLYCCRHASLIPCNQAYFVPEASDGNHITTASLYLYI